MYEIGDIKNTIICGDCLEELDKFPDNCIDAIITDPPAGIGFMGKEWDKYSDFQDFIYQVFSKAIRVIKPGGLILVWALPRISHYTAMGIERAGFEIRDKIYYCFGSGFPKSLNIGKAIDKDACEKQLTEKLGRKPTKEEFEKEWKNFRKVIGKGKSGKTAIWQEQGGMGNFDLTEPATPEAKQWEGWGTALKPAVEEWILARKPLSEKTIAENVLKWGTGGININECRIGISNEDKIEIKAKKNKKITTNNIIKGFGNNTAQFGDWEMSKGRYPANLILDEKAGKMLDEQSGILKSGRRSSSYHVENKKGEMFNNGIYGKYKAKNFDDVPASEGGASRFFYCAKASKAERSMGLGDDKRNNHPTVKPVALMRYLVKLITPPNGIILDMFLGSGTTAIACILEGFNWIGIEKEKDYCEIAEKRIDSVKGNLFK